MNYPFWDIPHLGSGWVIGLIAIYHVMISQFAVGGGFYLPLAERKAMRMTDPALRADWLKQLASHSKFFLILTAVFGTVSGVGIWFAIGLTHPEATSTLIHNFVFGWAMEWVFFMVELTTIAVYYYTWNRIPEKLHLKVGWVYAGASAATLIIINGILSFMLTPGDTWIGVAGTGHEASKFWNAFFNPTYWPSLAAPHLCLRFTGRHMGADYRQPHRWRQATRTQDQHGAVEREVAGSVVRGHAVPDDLVLRDGSGIAARPLDTGHRHHQLGHLLDRHAHGAHHHRHIGDHYLCCLLSRLSQSKGVQSFACAGGSGSCADGHGRRRVFARNAAQAVRDRALDVLQWRARAVCEPRSMRRDISPTPHWVWNGSTSSYSRGEAIFRGECGSCHTLQGYRPLAHLLEGRDRANIHNFIVMLHENKADSPYRKFMPPMVGTDQDVNDLTDFLNAQVNPPAPGAQKPVLTAKK